MKKIICSNHKMPTGYDYTDYDENVDYKNLHLLWIAKHKEFLPKHPLIPRFKNYLEQQKDLYDSQIKLNKTAYYYYKDDVYFSRERFDIDKKTKELFNFYNNVDDSKMFVTINFEDDMEKFKKNKRQILNNLKNFLNSKIITEGKAVFEYHGTNAHPHIMMLLTPTDNYKTWGKFRKQILRTALCKMVDENFTDVKTGKDYHEKYLNLEKKEEKKEALEKDVLWRKENGLEEVYNRD